MDFSTISNINAFTKIQVYKNKSNFGFAPSTQKAEPDQTSANVFRAQQNQGSDDRLSYIITKMQSGEELSSGELAYLKEKSPAAYEQAVKQGRDRETYKEELHRCKTKEDVRMLHLAKIAPIFAKVNAAAARNDLATVQSAGAEAAALAAIFEKFTATKEYAEKAENHMEYEKAVKAEHESMSGVKDDKSKHENKPKVEKVKDEETSNVNKPDEPILEESDAPEIVSTKDNRVDIKPVHMDGDANPKAPIEKTDTDISVYNKAYKATLETTKSPQSTSGISTSKVDIKA